MIRPSLFLATLLVSPVASFAQDAVPTPTEIARSYFEAMGRKDLDAAEALFAEKSSVFESGGDEGDWAHYRAHHIGAELDSINRFERPSARPRKRSAMTARWLSSPGRSSTTSRFGTTARSTAVALSRSSWSVRMTVSAFVTCTGPRDENKEDPIEASTKDVDPQDAKALS